MAEKQLKTRIQLKIDTEENWSKATNFIPKEGEVIFYKPDDGNPRYRIKIGDGTTTVNSLSFAFDIDTELSATSINPVQNSAINTALSSKAEKGNFIPFVTATYSKTESNDTFYTATVDEWSDANTGDDLEGRIVYIKLDTDVSTSNAKISFNGFDAMYIMRRTSGTNEAFTSTFNDALVSEVPFLALIGRIYFGNTTSLRCIVLDQGTRAYGGSDFAKPVNINKGGTGATTASDALTNLGAVKKTGDTMTGSLTIENSISSSLKLDDTSSNSRGDIFEYNNKLALDSKDLNVGDSRRLVISNATAEASKDRALLYTDVNSDGSGTAYRIFHAGMETPIPIANGGTGALTASGALTNLGAVAKSGDTMGGTLIANATSVATLGTAQVRNIWAGTADISKVENSLNEGDIYLQYEGG